MAKLNVSRYDVLAASKGFTTVESQADWHGVHRSTMFRLRAGGAASLDVAMRIARQCDVAVEFLFGPVA